MSTFVLKADYHNEKHVLAIKKLMAAYSRDPMGGSQELCDTTLQNLISGLRQRSHAHSFLLYDGQCAVGLANCFEGFSTFKARPLLNIHDFVILSEQRGLGLSQTLLTAIETFCRKNHFCKMTLEVLSNNKPAKRAYQRFGFEPYQLDVSAGSALFWEKPL